MTADQDTLSLLDAARSGDRSAFDRLYGRVYAELRGIARHRLSGYRPGDTLNTTALVHEAYIKLAGQAGAGAEDRAHLLALASRAMRFILVDHARARQVLKRGAGAVPVPLDAVQLAAGSPGPDLIALDEALERLRRVDDRQCQLIEYRFFGGLTYSEIADVMGVSVRTVKRDWTKARTWLYTYMQTT